MKVGAKHSYGTSAANVDGKMLGMVLLPLLREVRRSLKGWSLPVYNKSHSKLCGQHSEIQ